MKTERIMKQIVNILIMVVVMMTSMFLLYVKVTSEFKREKRKSKISEMYGNAKERKNPYVEKRNIFVLLAANAVSYLPDIVVLRL